MASDNFQKICAIVDAQGFQFNDKFIPREVAVVSDYISQCQELNCKIKWNELTEQEQAIIIYSKNYVHGLHYLPFNHKYFCYIYDYKDIGKLLTMWYEMIATEERPYFAYKNYQLGKILNEINIPAIDLDNKELNFLTVEELQKKYKDNYLCAFHKRSMNSNKILTCALRKSAHIYREIKSRLNNETME